MTIPDILFTPKKQYEMQCFLPNSFRKQLTGDSCSSMVSASSSASPRPTCLKTKTTYCTQWETSESQEQTVVSYLSHRFLKETNHSTVQTRNIRVHQRRCPEDQVPWLPVHSELAQLKGWQNVYRNSSTAVEGRHSDDHCWDFNHKKDNTNSQESPVDKHTVREALDSDVWVWRPPSLTGVLAQQKVS